MEQGCDGEQEWVPEKVVSVSLRMMCSVAGTFFEIYWKRITNSLALTLKLKHCFVSKNAINHTVSGCHFQRAKIRLANSDGHKDAALLQFQSLQNNYVARTAECDYFSEASPANACLEANACRGR